MSGARRPTAREDLTKPVEDDTAVTLPAEQSLSGAVADRTDCAGVTTATGARVGV